MVTNKNLEIFYFDNILGMSKISCYYLIKSNQVQYFSLNFIVLKLNFHTKRKFFDSKYDFLFKFLLQIDNPIIFVFFFNEIIVYASSLIINYDDYPLK